MTEHRETTRYATPSLTWNHHARGWYVDAHPWKETVGVVRDRPPGWTATAQNGRYAGLFPNKQAAAEVLVRQAGYELGEVT